MLFERVRLIAQLDTVEAALLTIRAYTEPDHDAVVALWQECFPDDPDRNAPAQMIERMLSVDREMFLVGLWRDSVVATALCGYDGVRGWVYHVATAPGLRRRGLGRQMMLAVERTLGRRGCPKLNLQVRAGNEAAVRFYRALGYQVEQRVSMGKPLPPPAGDDESFG